MRAIWLALFSCAVWRRVPARPTTEQAPAASRTAAATPAPERAGVRPGRSPSVDVTGTKPQPARTRPLKDPNNILSKRSIFYDLDQYDVKDEYKPLVEAHAQATCATTRAAKMLIQGNTDERGSREYNIALGQKRSDGVKRMLLLLGAKEDQVESVSLGEEKPRGRGP